MADSSDIFGSEETRLLAAIHDDPKNDGPRLAWAAWLNGHGATEHAEFIRLQCRQPYIALCSGDPDHLGQSSSHEFPRDDPTAKGRLARLIALFPAVYSSTRYVKQRKLRYYEEHARGLPLVHEELEDDWLAAGDALLVEIGLLSRLDLTLRTAKLADWLAHPVMARVDNLHIWAVLPDDAERDEDCTMNSYYDVYWAKNIPVLAASPITDRLQELNPCGCHSTGQLTARSTENMALCRELLEPRVYVEYSF